MKEVIKPNLKIGKKEYWNCIEDYLCDSEIYFLFKDKIENQDYSFLDDENVKEGIKRRLQYIVKYKFEDEIIEDVRSIKDLIRALITNILLCIYVDENNYDDYVMDARIHQLTGHIEHNCKPDESLGFTEEYIQIMKETINKNIDKIWHDVYWYNIKPFYKFNRTNIGLEYPPEDLTIDDLTNEDFIKDLIRRLKDERNN